MQVASWLSSSPADHSFQATTVSRKKMSAGLNNQWRDVCRNWSNYKSSEYLWHTDEWNPQQNYKWRGIFWIIYVTLCISPWSIPFVRQFFIYVPFHKWRKKTFRLCSLMQILWVRIRKLIVKKTRIVYFKQSIWWKKCWK